MWKESIPNGNWAIARVNPPKLVHTGCVLFCKITKFAYTQKKKQYKESMETYFSETKMWNIFLWNKDDIFSDTKMCLYIFIQIFRELSLFSLFCVVKYQFNFNWVKSVPFNWHWEGFEKYQNPTTLVISCKAEWSKCTLALANSLSRHQASLKRIFQLKLHCSMSNKRFWKLGYFVLFWIRISRAR